MDQEGSFFRHRKKEVIRRRGVNISSFEVEAEVLSHPLVTQAAAIAVKNLAMEHAGPREGRDKFKREELN
jgi:acyl-coenzyme A synthetase/AMP-(fatty) acid ligase